MDLSKARSMVEGVVRRHSHRSGGVPEPLRSDHRLTSDLGMNSADLIDAVLDLEEECGISIKDEEIARLLTISDIALLVSQKAG